MWKTGGTRYYYLSYMFGARLLLHGGGLLSLQNWADSHESQPTKKWIELDGIAVWTSSNAAMSTISRFSEQDALFSDVFHFSGLYWRDEFRRFVRTLDERAIVNCHAVPRCSKGTFQPWESVPLAQMVRRMDCDWFPTLLNEHSLLAHLQPIWSLKENRVFGFEALSRARNCDGEVNGGQLLDAAKVHNMLAAFDLAARRTAIVQGSHHLAENEYLFVNIIPSMVDSPERDFAGAWAAIRACGFDPKRLVFEFVESEEFPSIDKLSRIVGHIREKGALIALDDFGAGHASLTMLDDLRPDIVKFDRALIPNEGSTTKAGLLQGLVKYAQALGIKTVAEGIETIDQLGFVEECGFDLAQGWLIGRPAEVPMRPTRIVHE